MSKRMREGPGHAQGGIEQFASRLLPDSLISFP